MTKITRLAESDADLEKVSRVMLQLRTWFDKETLIAQIKQQQRSGYQVAYVECEGDVLCVALREGFNIESHQFSMADLD